MPEKKQYISHNNEHGQVFISEDVIASIAYHALNENEGFAGLSARTSADFAAPLNSKNWHKGLSVTITDKGNLLLEMNVLVVYGANVIQVAKAIQKSVSDAVGSTTGLYPKRVHVNICGIVRK